VKALLAVRARHRGARSRCRDNHGRWPRLIRSIEKPAPFPTHDAHGYSRVVIAFVHFDKPVARTDPW